MYIDKPLREYLDDLAAKKPAPGGGSAAALAAAIGAGLMSMVANYTVNNPKYKASQEKMAEILVKSENFRREFEGLVDKDVEAYKKLSMVRQGSPSTLSNVEGSKAMKGLPIDLSKLDEAYKEAVVPPFDICKAASACLKLCADLAEGCNKNLITDTAIAAIMLEGAFFSAKFNVYINLKYIKDIDFIGGLHKVLAPLEESVPKLKDEVLELCEEIIQR